MGALLIAIGVYCLLSRKLSLGILFWGFPFGHTIPPASSPPLSHFLSNYKSSPYPTINHELSTNNYLIYPHVSPAAYAVRSSQIKLADDPGFRGNCSNRPVTIPPRRPVIVQQSYLFPISLWPELHELLLSGFSISQGGNHYQFSVQNHGLLYLISAPFFYIGILDLIKNYKLKIKNLVWVWLLLAPIAGSLTRDAPHVLRAVPMLPLPMLLTAVGLDHFGRNVKILFFVVILLSIINYLLITKSYRNNFSSSWQYGYSEVVQFIKQQYSNYDQIIFTKNMVNRMNTSLIFGPGNQLILAKPNHGIITPTGIG